MASHVKEILIGLLLMTLSYTAVAEVVTLSVFTDGSWKSLDFEHEGWTFENYDDSWWSPPGEWPSYSTPLDPAKFIWYPGEIHPEIVYFRDTFEIDGTNILNGKLFTSTYGEGGTIYLFINGYSLPKIVSGNNRNPTELDITSYLKPGKNVIAAQVKVLAGDYHIWNLLSTIRYDKSTPGGPIN